MTPKIKKENLSRGFGVKFGRGILTVKMETPVWGGLRRRTPTGPPVGPHDEDL